MFFPLFQDGDLYKERSFTASKDDGITMSYQARQRISECSRICVQKAVISCHPAAERPSVALI